MLKANLGTNIVYRSISNYIAGKHSIKEASSKVLGIAESGYYLVLVNPSLDGKFCFSLTSFTLNCSLLKYSNAKFISNLCNYDGEKGCWILPESIVEVDPCEDE
ncbi:MAG: hypothetical protein ACOYLO_00275 [Ferruginibacter sp.]